MPLQFTKHEVISLKGHADFSEKWLQDTIADDPSILGMGDLELIDRERVQEHSGRLDLLLTDGDATRYEVELMLGSTDPSHIIRCIEYWDTERRRYPAYEHIAILIAEDITTRFLNVMSLMAGNIPMIAIQLCALRVGDQLLLNFVPVLNQTTLRRDDDGTVGSQVDRAYWEARVGREVMSIADEMLELVNAATNGKYELKYLKRHVAISEHGGFFNVVSLSPKKKYAHIWRLSVDDPESWIKRFEETPIAASKGRQNRMRLTVTPEQFRTHRDLLKELIQEAMGENMETAKP